MRKPAVVTDSNSGITQNSASAMGITVIPMPFTINGRLFQEDINLTQEKFYEMLSVGAEISTSQPSISDITECWDKLLNDYDEIVHIPMSSGLSSSCQTALMLSADFNGRVHVVNNHRISVTQKQSVFDALKMAQNGANGLLIKQELEKTAFDASIYITLETLNYLKKGGRITPAAAALASLLKIKPILQIQGEKLDSFSKARTKKLAKKIMVDAMLKDIKERFNSDDKNIIIHVAYSGTDNTEALGFKKELEEIFPANKIPCDPLSLSIACHIGPGSLAIACTKIPDCLRI
mgnify:FL=1